MRFIGTTNIILVHIIIIVTSVSCRSVEEQNEHQPAEPDVEYDLEPFGAINSFVMSDENGTSIKPGLYDVSPTTGSGTTEVTPAGGEDSSTGSGTTQEMRSPESTTQEPADGGTISSANESTESDGDHTMQFSTESIFPTEFDNSTDDGGGEPGEENEGGGGLSDGEIAAIVVCSTVGVLLIGGGAYYAYSKREKYAELSGSNTSSDRTMPPFDNPAYSSIGDEASSAPKYTFNKTSL